MSSELISIIIPVYNHNKALNKALTSIAEQSYKNIEVIVVDDGSDIPVSFSDKYTLVRQNNLGAPSARNHGMSFAKGEYIIFWDADVIARFDFLEILYITLQKNLDASFAYSNMHFGNHDMKAKKFDILELRKNNFIHTTSLIRRKDIIDWDESIKRFQDWDMWLSLSEKGRRGVWIDQFLFTVLEDNGKISFWLPKFAYKKPWKWFPWISSRVAQYEKARDIVIQKHKIN